MPYIDHQDGDASALVAESAGNERRQYDPEAVKQYTRLAVIDYATFLKESSFRSPEINERALERALLYKSAALRAGADEEAIEKTFRQLRGYWIPRLVAANSKATGQIASAASTIIASGRD
jgi:hypothetical protein